MTSVSWSTFSSFVLALLEAWQHAYNVSPSIGNLVLATISVVSFHLGTLFPTQRRLDEVNRVDITEKCTEGLAGGKIGLVLPIFALCEEEIRKLGEALRHIESARVVVVDDCSPCGAIGDILPRGVKILRLSRNMGPATARNVGLQEAARLGCEVVLFCDADCIPTERWVQSLSASVKSRALYGGVTCAAEKHYIGLFHDLFGTLNPRPFLADPTTAVFAPSCNLAMSIDTAREISPTLEIFPKDFPAAAFEDVHLGVAARELGIPTIIVKSAEIQHRFSSSILDLARQFFRYGQSQHLVLERFPFYPSLLAESTTLSFPSKASP